jgi:hypothetical protein
MNIRFTSSLTPEDENALAPALIRAVAGILDLLPIAYMIRIDTSDSKIYQHSAANSQVPHRAQTGFPRPISIKSAALAPVSDYSD